MRKISITALLIAVVITTAAQKIQIGISAGINSASMVAHASGISVHSDGRIGIMFGLTGDVQVAERFSIQPAVNFVQKGYKYKETDVNYVYTDEIRVNYLEIPINVIFRPQTPKVQFFMGAGPSFAFALSGKEKENDNGTIDEWDLSFGSDENNDDMKAVDFGLNFLAGIQLPIGLSFAINYNLGLSNLVPGSNVDGSIKNNYVGFGIGYMFHGNKK